MTCLLTNPALYVCSTRTLGELDERFQFKSNKSRLVHDVTPGMESNGVEDSQFEGITHIPSTDTLLVVKEEAEHGGGLSNVRDLFHAHMAPASRALTVPPGSVPI